MKLCKLIISTLSLLMLLMSATAQASKRAEVAWQMIENGALLVDVRTPAEYQSQHLDGAVNLPLSSVPTAFKDIDKDQLVVVYCRSGNRSGQALNYLVQKGYTRVFNGGGLNEMLATKETPAGDVRKD